MPERSPPPPLLRTNARIVLERAKAYSVLTRWRRTSARFSVCNSSTGVPVPLPTGTGQVGAVAGGRMARGRRAASPSGSMRLMSSRRAGERRQGLAAPRSVRVA